MEVLLGSAALVGSLLLLCELLRSVSRRILAPGWQELALEVVSTLQLTCCTLEMVLLGTVGRLKLWVALTLTYLQVVLHCLTTQGATCNPCGSASQWLRAQATGGDTAPRIGAQFAGAALSLVLMPGLWALGLSPLHEVAGECSSPLNVAPLAGALVEMTCTLCLCIMLHFLPRVKPQFQPHLVALTITGIVYAGAHLTGAVFNPALAFIVMLQCQGSTLQQYLSIYCLGPLVGTILSILALDGGIARLKAAQRLPKRD